MNNRFGINNKDEEKLWKEAIIVFDASSILNLYEYSEKSRQDIFNLIKSFKNEKWIPFNVHFEYLKNKSKPIGTTISKYDDLSNSLKNIESHFDQIKNKTKSEDKHPFIDSNLVSTFEKNIKDFKTALNEIINVKKEELNTFSTNDIILEFVNENFKIGDEYPFSKTIEIIKEGEFRYRNTIPPGYKDELEKKGFAKYGDLIIWKQIIDKSIASNKPIVYIMDDLKEDWWHLDKKNNPILPRVELIEEFKENNNLSFWMYSSSQFLEKNKNKVEKNTLLEVNTWIQNSVIKDLQITRIQKSFDVELSANRGDEEPWRVERLKRVLKSYSDKNEIVNFDELHDHKGSLTVHWIKQPTVNERNDIEQAWEKENELSENVQHLEI
ncbi:MAG TPA: PIN-like domain-containing protein [Fluviicola sp.]|nr:PIN-like domain-containing protein [Fluviicola sp.]